MPKRHQHVILTIAVLLAAYICWHIVNRQQKKDALARQYAAFNLPAPPRPSSVKDQERLLSAISRKNQLEDQPSRDSPCIMFTLQIPTTPGKDEQPIAFYLFPDGKIDITAIKGKDGRSQTGKTEPPANPKK